MAQIQSLSNARQRLYAAKWTRRNRADYQEQIKRLDRQIADLWHNHRCELASTARPVMALLRINQESAAIAEDYFEQAGFPLSKTGHQILDGGKWRSVETNVLAQAVGRYVAEIPANDPADFPIDPDVPPLKDILNRRGVTLEWCRTEGGHTYSRVVALST